MSPRVSGSEEQRRRRRDYGHHSNTDRDDEAGEYEPPANLPAHQGEHAPNRRQRSPSKPRSMQEASIQGNSYAEDELGTSHNDNFELQSTEPQPHRRYGATTRAPAHITQGTNPPPRRDSESYAAQPASFRYTYGQDAPSQPRSRRRESVSQADRGSVADLDLNIPQHNAHQLSREDEVQARPISTRMMHDTIPPSRGNSELYVTQPASLRSTYSQDTPSQLQARRRESVSRTRMVESLNMSRQNVSLENDDRQTHLHLPTEARFVKSAIDDIDDDGDYYQEEEDWDDDHAHKPRQGPPSQMSSRVISPDIAEYTGRRLPPAQKGHNMSSDYRIRAGTQQPFHTLPSVRSEIFKPDLNHSFREFADIAVGNFKDLTTFVFGKPSVLSEDRLTLQKVVVTCYQHGADALGDQIVDRLVLINHCAKLKSIQESLQHIVELRGNASKILRTHQQQFKVIRDHLRKVASNNSGGSEASEVRSQSDTSAGLKMSTSYATAQDPRRQQYSHQTATHPLSSSVKGSGMGSYATSPRADNLEQLRRGVESLSMSGAAPIDDNMTASLVTHQDAVFLSKNTRFVSGDYEPRINDAKNFFDRGRVFRMRWYEPAGRNTHTDMDIIHGPNGDRIHSKLIWMVVIFQRHGCCICCPIVTYGGQGLKKSGLSESDIRAHAIIYSEGVSPVRLVDEAATSKDPIKVKMLADKEPMHKASRVNFGRTHTVNWDASIMNMGRVVAGHRDLLVDYFRTEYERVSRPGAKMTTKSK